MARRDAGARRQGKQAKSTHQQDSQPLHRPTILSLSRESFLQRVKHHLQRQHVGAQTHLHHQLFYNPRALHCTFLLLSCAEIKAASLTKRYSSNRKSFLRSLRDSSACPSTACYSSISCTCPVVKYTRSEKFGTGEKSFQRSTLGRNSSTRLTQQGCSIRT